MLELAIQVEMHGFRLDLDLETQNGEILALFGPSGTGKTTTLRCVAGLLRPLRGRVVLDGDVLFDSQLGINVPSRARKVGYVPQNYALFPHLTVAQNIAFGLSGMSRTERRERAQEMLAVMRLTGLETRRPSQLSGGQQQRVALARALVTRPRLLLLDEPFAALDEAISNRLQSELLALPARYRIPTLLVTHNLAEAYALCDRLAVLGNGRVLQIGPKEEVLREPNCRAVARFVGTKNIFDGTAVGSENGQMVVRWGTHAIRVPTSRTSASGERVTFCIRPEAVIVVRPDRPLRPSLSDNVVGACFVREIPLGTTHRMFFKAEGDSQRDYDIEIVLPHHAFQRLALSIGQSVHLSLKANAIHLLPKEDRPETVSRWTAGETAVENEEGRQDDVTDFVRGTGWGEKPAVWERQGATGDTGPTSGCADRGSVTRRLG
jgi:molybdate transport system ATP-binding protein